MRRGKADFKEAVTRACTGDFDHPLTPAMRAQGLDFYSARVREIAGAALDRPDFTVLRFERSLRKQVLRHLRAHTEVPRGLAVAHSQRSAVTDQQAQALHRVLRRRAVRSRR